MGVTSYQDPTVAAVNTARDQINGGAVGQVEDGLKAIRAGTMLSKVKAVVQGLTGAGLTGLSQDITSAGVKALATVTGISLKSGENLPPIGIIGTLFVLGGSTGSTGARAIMPAGATGATVSATLATVSDDGKTLAFEASVAGFVIEYMPAPYGGADQTITEGGA